MSKKQAVYWWRNDLRIKDNISLSKAAESVNELIHVFFWKDEWEDETEFGVARLSEKRKAFLHQSLKSLDNELEKKGARLIIIKGEFEDSIKLLLKEFPFESVFAEEGICSEELQEEKLFARLSGAVLHLNDKSSLVPEESLPFEVDDLPDIFSSYRKKVEKQAEVPLPIPETEKIPFCPEVDIDSYDHKYDIKPDERSVFPFRGGIKEAEHRLHQYIWKDQNINTYKKTRNGLVGVDYSSKFSPFLAVGSISARQIYTEIKKFETEVKKNSSTYWLVFELLWRDFFRCVARKFGDQIFYSGGIKFGQKRWLKNERVFRSWTDGETGDPFVDANMKELSQTGFMSNRGRQNVASYLVHDMGIDWRLGAMWFEYHLLDYDPQSNWGNWMYLAGVGNDPRENRKFNTQLQAERYDPESSYQKLWLDD